MMGASGGAQMTEEERRLAAQLIWNQEKGLAAVFLTLGWLCKVRSSGISHMSFNLELIPSRPVSIDLLCNPSLLLRLAPPKRLIPLPPLISLNRRSRSRRRLQALSFHFRPRFTTESRRRIRIGRRTVLSCPITAHIFLRSPFPPPTHQCWATGRVETSTHRIGVGTNSP